MSDIHENSPPGLTAGRAVLLAAGAGYLALLIYQALTLPHEVPGHVGPTGRVTWWGNKGMHLTIASVVGLGLFLLMWNIPRMMRSLPPELINLPNKDYWLAPENREQAQRMMAADMGWIGAATIGLVGYAVWEMGHIARGGEVNMAAFWVIFAIYLILTIGWSIWSTVGPRWKPPVHPFG
ncbi:MAG: hypothetical protein Q4G35_05335 [Propionibacteriaceae bacterium]|nr:hypothetical protein [Propionibacteriaceae bacterium]